MEAKHLVEEVNVHPNHPLTRSLDPQGTYVYIYMYILYMLSSCCYLLIMESSLSYLNLNKKETITRTWLHSSIAKLLWLKGGRICWTNLCSWLNPVIGKMGGGTLWDGGPLNSEGHIKLVVRGYLLDPNPLLKGRFLGEWKTAGRGPHPKDFPSIFPMTLWKLGVFYRLKHCIKQPSESIDYLCLESKTVEIPWYFIA